MSLKKADYPDAIDPDLVGSYPASAKAGGGYVWDVVLEYRVWCHPKRGAAGLDDGSDYYYAFATYDERLELEVGRWEDRLDGGDGVVGLP